MRVIAGPPHAVAAAALHLTPALAPFRHEALVLVVEDDAGAGMPEAIPTIAAAYARWTALNRAGPGVYELRIV